MPPTNKGRQTEAAFLDAARRCFADKGYLNTKISDIAAAAGRSTGSFYNYYDNKDQLLEALLDQFSNEVVEGSLATRHADPEAGVRAAVTSYWTTYKKYLPEIIGLFQMSMLDDEFRDRWHANRASGIKQVLAGLHIAERAGYHIGLPLEPLASALVNTLESSCWSWLAVRGGVVGSIPDDDTAIDILTTIWYRTVYRSGPHIQR
ncbi:MULTISPECIES: TetR/AcrR family transcriptional regulator [Gordonia]|uniref:TetR/AcrR family transcriptional regulator n=1 Tax=Gordonia amicalis TaxID=89053 RepID=A0ABU4DCX6_9ACTN|nr:MULTISPECIES: TetR/AcrR family transcriptional regulator [Gordonia]ATD72698.1 TetR/AcrR family transcriptional regulator [Gordonia sp. 1D]MBA5846725.1 TetR/AcrR family transcriptional regulator [Gordonia amicalis]MDV6307226.1 TetR/AcrR family transcriptional regulator [Gordonia amicalis]MDV7100018.1 TetR/AcrR family transcriptional regulator [Gordonia amicalis]MDV7172417.1 TetR/AcrR family transcriptional regulator [Gordonia amicalis]